MKHQDLSTGPTLSERTISAVEKIITGDEIRRGGKRLAPYRSGPEIIRFFNEFGFNDVYSGGSGTPPRRDMAESRLRERQGDRRLVQIIEEALHPEHFRGTEFDLDEAKDHIARVMKDDGMDLVAVSGRYRVRSLSGQTVTMEKTLDGPDELTHEFITEQIAKCDTKLREGDFPGAITNARSLIEAILLYLERRLDPSPPEYEGELGKLYKRVRILMHLDPKGGATQALTLILSGLSNVVDGLSAMRNSMSDAHARTYRPERHHAKLAVNAAKTVADFFFDTFEYQVQRGLLKPLQSESGSDPF